MEAMTIINQVISVLFFVCCAYQGVYVIVALIKKHKNHPDAAPGRYAVLVAARNEEAVIGALIKSVQDQNYPRELLDIYVVADNCTDDTASVARLCGATCWERFDKTQVGKGYALKFLLDMIKAREGNSYDGYFVFDADNLLDENFVFEMNKAFAAGNRVVTSYRNSKNYGDNWISAGYSTWFLRDSRFMDGARNILGTSCKIAGTGFLVHRDIIEKIGGWKYFTLTEDTEFTMDLILRGECAGYCGTAVLYDEQPTDFKQSWYQRLRWTRGYLQVFGKYGRDLIKRFFTRLDFAVFDMVMTYLPAIVLGFAGLVTGLAAAVYMLVTGQGTIISALLPLVKSGLGAYLGMLMIGALTTATEWKQIHCSNAKKIGYLFTFPIFMMTYIPIGVAALFCKVEWKPIHHSVRKSLKEVKNTNLAA